MKRYKLGAEQISKLIKDNRVYIDNNTTIEVYDNELILNNKGKITKLDNMSLSFSDINEPYSFLHAMVCDYFNLEYQNVICLSADIEEAIFRVRFSHKKEISIIVCPMAMAIKNTSTVFEEENIEKYITKNQIGFYHRLGNSDYFFRWEEDF